MFPLSAVAHLITCAVQRHAVVSFSPLMYPERTLRANTDQRPCIPRNRALPGLIGGTAEVGTGSGVVRNL
jgi:hypothetical protein